MSVQVTLLGPLRDLAQTGALESDAPDVAALLAELGQRFGPDFARRAASARILVDGSPIQFGRGRATRLLAGSEVALVFPVGGG